MAKDQMYTQCSLERPLESGQKEIDEVWIPTELAKVGKKLKVLKKNWAPPTWENGWVVVAKGVTRSASDLAEHERDYLHQREASDI